MYRALYAFRSAEPNALAFAAGETFLVLERSSAHWWLAARAQSGETGYVPPAYLRRLQVRAPGLPLPGLSPLPGASGPDPRLPAPGNRRNRELTFLGPPGPQDPQVPAPRLLSRRTFGCPRAAGSPNPRPLRTAGPPGPQPPGSPKL